MTTIDAVGFADWVQSAKPRELIVYFKGLLMRDRKEDEAINAIANSAYAFFESRKITLTQQHDSLGGCSYVAIKL